MGRTEETYTPNPLPPPVGLDSRELHRLLLDARGALGELNGFSLAVPNPFLLLMPSITRESVESSQIENINATVEQALQGDLFSEEEQRQPDREVLRYRDAILWGWKEFERFPIGHRLICGIFERLMPAQGGEYQRSAIAIQNSMEVIYTPPTADRIPDLIAQWERFQNDASGALDPIVKAILLHYQFEAIHPFVDGNRRTGRILLVLSLVQDGLLRLPILYLSAFINRNRGEYYRLLAGVTKQGEWMEWVLFLTRGILEQARSTARTLMKVAALYRTQRERIRELPGKLAALEIGERIFLAPILSPACLGRKLGVHYTTASRYLKTLEAANILENVEYGKYQLYVDRELISLISGGRQGGTQPQQRV